MEQIDEICTGYIARFERRQKRAARIDMLVYSAIVIILTFVCCGCAVAIS